MIYQDLKRLKVVALGLTLLMAVLVTPTLYAADMEVEILVRELYGVWKNIDEDCVIDWEV